MTISDKELSFFWVSDPVASNCRTEADIDSGKLHADFVSFRGVDRYGRHLKSYIRPRHNSHSIAVQEALSRMETGYCDPIQTSIFLFEGNIKRAVMFSGIIENAIRLQIPRYGASISKCLGCSKCL